MAVTETTGLAGQSRNSFTGRLKTDYLPKWDDHVHKMVVVADLIAKKKGTMGGLESLGSVMDTLPQSVGVAAFEGATLPTPRAGSYFQPTLHARSIYARLRWTGHVQRAARKGDKVAWARPRQEDMKAANEQFKLNFARMLYLGPYQPLATVSSFNGTTTATLYGRDARRSGTDDLWKFGSHYLRVNMEIDYVAASGGNVDADGAPVIAAAGTATGTRISAIDNSTYTAPTITFADDPASLNGTPADPGDESIIIPAGSRRDAPAASDITEFAGVNGLMQIVADQNIYTHLYDLARSSYPTLEGKRNRDSGGVARPFTEDYFTLAIDRIADEGVGDEPDNLLMDRATRREYVKESKGDRRFKEVQTEKGFGQLQFHAGDALTPIKTDRDCPPGIAFVLCAKDFSYLEESPLGSVDGADRFVADQDAHEIVLHKSGNVFTTKPFNNGTVEDIDFLTRDLVA